ncbi:MAG: hypothetical protein ACI8RD_011799 [Bacillariaceae sp.]|jgi:hypothetical protein
MKTKLFRMFFILFGSLSPSIFVLFRLLIRVQSSLLYYYVASVFKQQAINNLKFASQISNQRGTEKIRFFLDFHETRVVWSVVRRVYKFVIDKPIASFAIRSHLTSLVIRHLQHMKVSSLSLNH